MINEPRTNPITNHNLIDGKCISGEEENCLFLNELETGVHLPVQSRFLAQTTHFLTLGRKHTKYTECASLCDCALHITNVKKIPIHLMRNRYLCSLLFCFVYSLHYLDSEQQTKNVRQRCHLPSLEMLGMFCLHQRIGGCTLVHTVYT
jgi:hypothetical protein